MPPDRSQAASDLDATLCLGSGERLVVALVLVGVPFRELTDRLVERGPRTEV